MAIKRVRGRVGEGDETPQEPEHQLLDLCFNVHGHAFEAPKEYQAGQTFIIALPDSTKPYRAAIKAIEKEGGLKSRGSITLTDKERGDELDTSGNEYLLVGWVPHGSLLDSHSKIVAGARKQRPVGTSRPDAIIRMDFSKDLPLMAVVKVTEEAERGVKTFALLGQKNGLCTPYIVPQSDVFYLPQYRDNTTSSKERGGQWNRIIQRYSVRPSGDVSEKRQHFQRARDPTKFVVATENALCDEVWSLLGVYEQSTGSTWALDRLNRLFKNIVDPDLKFQPTNYPAMHEFVLVPASDAGPFDRVKASEFISEAKTAWRSWPEVADSLTEENVMAIKSSVDACHVVLTYKHLRLFFSLILRHKGDGVDLGAFVETTWDIVQHVVRDGEPHQSINEVGAQKVLSGVRAKLNAMVNGDDAFANMLRDSAGDQGIQANFQDLWEEVFCDSLESDRSKLAVMTLIRFLVSAFKYKESHMAELAQCIIEIIDEAGF